MVRFSQGTPSRLSKTATHDSTNEDGSIQTGADWILECTLIKRSISIGSGSTILCGVMIGDNAFVGEGSIITHDISDGAVVAGNPARLFALGKGR